VSGRTEWCAIKVAVVSVTVRDPSRIRGITYKSSEDELANFLLAFTIPCSVYAAQRENGRWELERTGK